MEKEMDEKDQVRKARKRKSDQMNREDSDQEIIDKDRREDSQW